MNHIKKIKIKSISDLELGDLVYIEGLEEYGVVYEIKTTLFHNHQFLRLAGSLGISGKYFENDFIWDNEDIFRPTKSDASLGEKEQ